LLTPKQASVEGNGRHRTPDDRAAPARELRPSALRLTLLAGFFCGDTQIARQNIVKPLPLGGDPHQASPIFAACAPGFRRGELGLFNVIVETLWHGASPRVRTSQRKNARIGQAFPEVPEWPF
jgi:hypothetical protein